MESTCGWASESHCPWPPSGLTLHQPAAGACLRARGKTVHPVPTASLSPLTPQGHGQPPPRPIPPLVTVRVPVRGPQGTELPEVGPHPKGPRGKVEEIDPLPEDLGSAGEAS